MNRNIASKPRHLVEETSSPGNNHVHYYFFILRKALKEELKTGEEEFAKLDEEKQAKERENEERLMDLRRCVYFVYHYLFDEQSNF